MAGQLVVCGSPIGNLGDAPSRLAETLSQADVVYAEDTRRSRKLLTHLGVSVPLRSYFVGNEAARAEELAERLTAGETVALITDAGMPGVADPGYSAVRVAVRVGAAVAVVPGPSAVTAALAVSGLPSERFVFESFLPRKGKARTDRLRQLAVEPRTMVLLTTKSRLVTDLTDLRTGLGPDRSCVVVREMTKVHEEIWRGSLGEAAEHWSERDRRGEFTLVVAGGPAREESLQDAVAEAEELISEGRSVSQAVKQVSQALGVNRNRLYEAVIQSRS